MYIYIYTYKYSKYDMCVQNRELQSPFSPLPKHQPFAMGDKIRGLTATSQRTQSSRDGQGGDAQKYGPGFSLTSRLRDFDFHPIARIKAVCCKFLFLGDFFLVK